MSASGAAIPAGSIEAGAEEAAGRPAIARGPLDWLVTTDHKQIGLLYMGTSIGFFLLGGLLAELMRAELASPGLQFTTEEAYAGLFTMHGTLMLLAFGTPVVAAFGNYLIPLQVGAPEMAYARLNALSYWLYLSGGILLLASFLAVGGPANGGWTMYVSNTSQAYAPGVGTDLWIIGVMLLGISTIMGALNFAVTILGRRAPGMTMLRLPMFCWLMLITAGLVLFSFPVLTAALAMLLIDRRLGGAFFDPAEGGSLVLYQHLFWFFGHPEVYILALPFFGIVSEIIPVFSGKPLFGYRYMVVAGIAIAGLSMAVWAHHMFTTGAVSLPFFSLVSFAIAVPTGIKLFNWTATMWGGRLRFTTAMLFAVGVIYVFVVGGISGVMVASPPLDYQAQDTYFVVAHFHNTLIGSTVFATFAGIYFWFPKATGRFLDERLGKLNFWGWVLGFTLTFVPQYELGVLGMPRRIADYSSARGWDTLNLVSTAGAVLLALGTVPFLVALVLAFRQPATATDDPWEGNSLEWATSSPPPHLGARRLPPIRSERPVYDARMAAVAGAGTAGPGPDPGGSDPAAAAPTAAMAEELRFFGRSAIIGLVLGVTYWFVSYEWVGTILLLGFGLAGLVAMLLSRSLAPDARGSVPRIWRWVPLAGSESATALVDPRGRVPAPTIAPLLIAMGLVLLLLAVVYGLLLALAGLVPLAAGARIWMSSASSEWWATDRHTGARQSADSGVG